MVIALELVIAILLSLCILGLVCDSDNVLYFFFQYSTAPGLVLLLVCRPLPVPRYQPRLA